MSLENKTNRSTYYLGHELIGRVSRVAKALGHSDSSFLRLFLAKTLPAEEKRVLETPEPAAE